MCHRNGNKHPDNLLRCLLEWELNRYQEMMLLRITVRMSDTIEIAQNLFFSVKGCSLQGLQACKLRRTMS